MMRKSLMWTIGIVSVGVLSGCAPSTKNEPKLTVAPSVPATQWRMVGHETYIVDGTVIGIGTQGAHPFLRLRIQHIILPGPPHTPSQLFPYDTGSTVKIPFEDAFATAGPMKPRLNEMVELAMNQYVAGNSKQPFWGSNQRGYAYKKADGQFYNEDGTVVAIAT